MKRLIHILILISGLTLVAPAAWASNSTKSKAPHVDLVTVPIPVITANDALVKDAPQGPPAKPQEMGLAFSTWMPSRFNSSSLVAGSSDYTRGDLPDLGINWSSSPIFEQKEGELRVHLAFNFTSMVRTGDLKYPGFSQTVSQQADLFAFGVGAEVRPAVLCSRSIQTHFILSAVPGVVMTQRSAFDEGRGILGIAGELDIGSAYDVGHYLTSVPVFVTLDVLGTMGSADGGSLSGTGIQAGLRFNL